MTESLLLKLLYIDPCIYRLWRVHFHIQHPNSEIICDLSSFDGIKIGNLTEFCSALSEKTD